MTDRTLMIKGPLSDDDMCDLVRLMQQIESRHNPDENFHVAIDTSESDMQIKEFLDRVPPLTGYQRVTVSATSRIDGTQPGAPPMGVPDEQNGQDQAFLGQDEGRGPRLA